MRDPLISPVFGDPGGCPPTIVTSGTRDLLLSQAVRVHRRLRDLGVDAVLQVFEGQSHAHYLRDANAPETKATFREISLLLRQAHGEIVGAARMERSKRSVTRG